MAFLSIYPDTMFQSGNQAHFEIRLEWCLRGATVPDDADFSPGQLQVDIASNNGTGVSVDFYDQGSGLSTDESCLRIAARSVNVTETLSFLEMAISFTPFSAGRKRRIESRRHRFVPLKTYQVSVVTTARSGGSLVAFENSTTLKRSQPLVFLECPPGPFVVVAAEGALTANVTWVPPTGYDGTDESSLVVTASHNPGDVFSIFESPHTVTYMAKNDQEEVTCTFTVSVTYNATVAAYTEEMNGTFPATAIRQYNRITHRVRQALIGEGLEPLQTLAAFDTSNVTELRLELVAPKGRPVALRTLPSILKAQVVVELLWRRAGNSSFIEDFITQPQEDVRVRLEFGGLNLEESAAVDAMSASASTQVLHATNKFRAEAAAVDAETGNLAILAYSKPFRRGITFETLTLVVLVPTGRKSAGGPVTWQLAPDSGLWIEYTFPASATPEEMFLGFVALHDTQAPIFSFCPRETIEIITVPGGSTAQPFWREPVARDNSGSLILTSTHVRGSLFGLHSPTDAPEQVTYTATDDFNNVATCTFGVRVVDREPPTLTMPAPFAVELPSTSRSLRARVAQAQLSPVSFSDNGHVDPTLVLPASDAELGVGSHVIIGQVRDAWGNEVTATTTVTVQDLTPPTITCPPSRTVPAHQDGSPVQVEWAAPVADDNDYDGGITRQLNITTVPPSGSLFSLGQTRVIASAIDMSGNMALCSFNVTVAPQVVVKASAALGTTATVGISLGIALGLFLLFLTILLRQRRKNRHQAQNWEEIFATMEQFKDTADQSTPTLEGPVVPREIKRTAVSLLDEVGKGAFGIVHKGLLKEDTRSASFLIAVKTLSVQSSSANRTELLEEAAIMAQFHSAFIVQLIGLVTVGTPVLMLVEYAEHGSLQGCLRDSGTDECTRLLWAGDVATGLQHIHEKGFLHRDLATRNVLVSSERRCKVSDFGLARALDEGDTYYRSRGGQLPVRWTAPEALEDRTFSRATDAWAFGITLFELWTKAAKPYVSMSNHKVWIEISNGYRLPQPLGCSDDIYATMRECWDASPAKRPDLGLLANRLRELHATHKKLSLHSARTDGSAKASRSDQATSSGSDYLESSLNSRASGNIVGHSLDSSAAVYEYDANVASVVLPNSITMGAPPSKEHAHNIRPSTYEYVDVTDEIQKVVSASAEE